MASPGAAWRRDANEKLWLRELREDYDWWLPAKTCARRICRKLGLTYGEPSYYRDIHVWLPDERWGHEEAYQAYKRETYTFFLLPVRRTAASEPPPASS